MSTLEDKYLRYDYYSIEGEEIDVDDMTLDTTQGAYFRNT
jgi:hypothetical protein